MFERFTERARKVVVLAQEEARTFNHSYTNTGHLLLGLLREDEGVAARAFSSLNLTFDEVREQVESIVGYDDEGTGGQTPLTRGVRRVLKRALQEALQLDHYHVGAEHILLGLVRESEGVAVRVFSNLDIDPSKVRRRVETMLHSGDPPQGGNDKREREDESPEDKPLGRTADVRWIIAGLMVQVLVGVLGASALVGAAAIETVGPSLINEASSGSKVVVERDDLIDKDVGEEESVVGVQATQLKEVALKKSDK